MNDKMNDERVNDDHCFLPITIRHYCLRMHYCDRPSLELNSIARYLSIKIIVICAKNDRKNSY